jgi:chromosome segregation ATPase
MKQNSVGTYCLLLTLLFVITVGGCAGTTSTDPKEGGLIGGIRGISSGKYEERIKQREERLQRLKETQKELDSEQAALEAERNAKGEKVQAQQRELDELLKKTETLTRDVENFQAELFEQETMQKDLNKKLSQLQHKIGDLSAKSHKGIKVEQLEAERTSLEKEYRLLLDLYRELSQ